MPELHIEPAEVNDELQMTDKKPRIDWVSLRQEEKFGLGLRSAFD